ncbi:MAG: L-threonylcarbamoyladenylate synthase [Desulfosalsimonadaceae bacterium]
MIAVDPKHPDPARIREAAGRVAEGGLAVFPTTCLYGLGADIFRPEALDRVFLAKRRPRNQPVSMLIRSPGELFSYAACVPPAARRLINSFWPGNVTLVFAAAGTVPQALAANTGKIGIRVPAQPAAAALLNYLEHPITATSANQAGQPGCADISGLSPELCIHTAVILDAGPLAGGKGSTVVDVTTDPPRVLREGAVSAARIRECLG